MCPFCGVVLYETGGGVRWGPVLIILLFLFPFIIPTLVALVRELTKEFSR